MTMQEYLDKLRDLETAFAALPPLSEIDILRVLPEMGPLVEIIERTVTEVKRVLAEGAQAALAESKRQAALAEPKRIEGLQP